MMKAQPLLPGCRGMERRPRRDSSEVLREAVRRVLPAVVAWIDPTGDEEYIEEQLLEAARTSLAYDGYAIAKELDDRHHWEVDSELVDILDRLDFEIDEIHRRNVESWVERNEIKPALQVGARAAFRHEGATVTGIVRSVDEKVAKYVVRCPELGHVESGVGTHGFLLAYEDVSPTSEKAHA